MPHSRQVRHRERERAIDPRPLIAGVFLAVALWLVSAGQAFGAVVPMNIEAMSRSATTVLLADVISVSSRADGAHGIATDVVLRPVKTMKGEPRSVVTIAMPGGTLGKEAVWVSDMPVFSEDERVIVFLDEEGRVIAGPQGRVDVVGETVPGENETLSRVEARITGAPKPGARNAFPELFGLVEEMPPGDAPDSSGEMVTMATPVVGSITPPLSPAGTGDTITISGSGFGPSRGTVEFFYREGRSPVVAGAQDIVEWSDTRVVTRVPVQIVSGYAAAPGCGPVTVVSANSERSAGTETTITFAYGGVSWPTVEQTYYVNANTPDTASELAMVQSAAAAWSGVGRFNLTYGGSTTASDLDISLGNGRNDVFWDDLADGYLGMARYRYTLGGSILEADFAFNDDWDWTDGTQSGTYDIQSTATHELGHWLNLRDQYGDGDADEIMYGWGYSGTQKRVLHEYDIAGIRWIYDREGDYTAPVTTASGAPAGWTDSNATVSLSATDTESGVAETLYRLGGGATQTYSTPVSIEAEGSTSLYYWSVDTSGNVEPNNVAIVQIDRTPPVTTAPSNREYVGVAQFDLAPADALSGTAQTQWSLDGRPPGVGTTVRITSAGNHSLTYYSTDRAGNRESEKAYSFEVSPAPDVVRVAGSTRYSTAIEISRRNYAEDACSTVVLATGADFADALAASGLAGCYDSPLLLTTSHSLGSGVLEEISRLGATEVVIVGGTSAVDESVAYQLASAGHKVTRVGGSDRYDTAAKVARLVAALQGGSFSGEAFLARGDSFADALAAAPHAYSRGMPILLTRPGSLPDATRLAAQDIGIHKVYVAGGTGAVGAGVVAQLHVTSERAAGSDRYATAAAVADMAVSKDWVAPSVAGLATGQNYPDALSGGVAMGARKGVILLTPASTLCPFAEETLRSCEYEIDEIQIFGGEDAVSPDTYDGVCRLWW